MLAPVRTSLDRRPRVGCVIAAIAGGTVIAVSLGFCAGATIPTAPVDDALAVSSFEREAEVAAHLGLTPGPRQTQALPVPADWEIPLALGPGECAAVIASASGAYDVSNLTIDDDGGPLVERASTHGIAQHVQWCSASGATLHARPVFGNRRGLFGDEGTGTLHYAIYRGALPGTFTALDRGVPTARGARSVPRDVHLAAADRFVGGRTPIAPPIEIASYRARLIPETVATYRRMHELSDNGRGDPVTPRYDPLPADTPAAWRPLAPSGVTPVASIRGSVSWHRTEDHPAVAFHEGEAHRLLAVVDPSVLGGCATIQFVRLLHGYRAVVRRSDGAYLTSQRNVASERVCGGGARAYIAPASDQERYLLRVVPG
jgi:hypothetical protein